MNIQTSGSEYNNVEVYITFLRRKLNLLQSNIKIKSVGGIGYKLEEKIEKWLTAIENIILSMDVSKVKIKNKKQKALELMKSVGLAEEHSKRKILKLSGGEQQRIAIARSLSYNPKIIIANESTGNLDKDTEDEILKIFKHLAKEENKCIIIVTHSQNVCDKVDIIYDLVNQKKVI